MKNYVMLTGITNTDTIQCDHKHVKHMYRKKE